MPEEGGRLYGYIVVCALSFYRRCYICYDYRLACEEKDGGFCVLGAVHELHRMDSVYDVQQLLQYDPGIVVEVERYSKIY